MSFARVRAPHIAGICTCVPSTRFDNLKDTTAFPEAEVRKVTGMAGIVARRVVDGDMCSSDLCVRAAEALLSELEIERHSIDSVIFISQTADHFMPSTSCILQDRLGLSPECASFDLGLGCSGYVYGLWVASSLLANAGTQRLLVLHGETPTRYTRSDDRAVALLFGDAGSATLLETSEVESGSWYFILRTDGSGCRDLIVEAGGFRDRFSQERSRHYVSMNGSNVFDFTIKAVPSLIDDTLEYAARSIPDVDYWIFHQSNRFIMKHLMKKSKLPVEKVPIVLQEFGNTGGPSVPLAITQGGLDRPEDRPLELMLLGYGTGLSWGSALIELSPDTWLGHVELDPVA